MGGPIHLRCIGPPIYLEELRLPLYRQSSTKTVYVRLPVAMLENKLAKRSRVCRAFSSTPAKKSKAVQVVAAARCAFPHILGMVAKKKMRAYSVLSTHTERVIAQMRDHLRSVYLIATEREGGGVSVGSPHFFTCLRVRVFDPKPPVAIGSNSPYPYPTRAGRLALDDFLPEAAGLFA